MECKDRGASPDAFYYPVQIKSPLDFTARTALEADLPGIPELLPSSSAGGLGSGEWGAPAEDPVRAETEWKL